MTQTPSALSVSLIIFAAGLLPSCGETSLCEATEIECNDECIPAIAATAEDVTEKVFVKSCFGSTCHTGSRPQKGLSLADLEAVKAAISKPSSQDPTVHLIAPGNASDSYIVRKMRGLNISDTGIMPPGVPLCEARIKAVEDWINQGAN